MKRLEFTKKVKIEMFLRAGGPGNLRCEKCNLPLRGKAHEYDHDIEEWERQDIEAGLRPPLTADEGKVLCIPCHRSKSSKKAGERAHVKAIVEKTAGARKTKAPMPCGRNSLMKKRMDGTLVWRDTGEPV